MDGPAWPGAPSAPAPPTFESAPAPPTSESAPAPPTPEATPGPLTPEGLLARFDEAAYLAANPDVAASVASGRFPSGREHYVRFGQAECRAPCPSPRRARLLGAIDPAARSGVEIGALDKPVVRKDEGAILYVDHADREELRRIFAHTDMDLSAIVEVDAVWGEKRLRECLPGPDPVDYVIASHVVEHVPDLLGWLLEIREVLAADGQLRLAVPDRRYTFDLLRPESGLADVLDAYLRGARAPLPRAVLEFVLCTREVSARDAWMGRIDLEALRRPVCPLQDALTLARDVLERGRYVDSHCWIFTPRSFAGLMQALAEDGLLGLACAEFHDTAPFEHEFFVALRPAGDPAEAARSWAAMAGRAAP